MPAVMQSPEREDMEREKFEALVTKAIEELAPEFRERLENVDVVVQDWPTPRQLAAVGLKGRRALLGLYQGVPVTKRGGHYGMVVPDKITIFQRPIEAICRSEEEMEGEIQSVVRHEIAHHFGISDARLRMMKREGLGDGNEE